MAEKDEYIKEAYEDLKKLSLDEQKRLEYEVRQKAIRDHNSQMKSAERRGEKRGIERRAGGGWWREARRAGGGAGERGRNRNPEYLKASCQG